MPRDFVGRDINIANTIVYPVRTGSRMELKAMRVHTIDHGTLIGTNASGRQVRVYSTSRCVVVDMPQVEEDDAEV